jgi:hypothetical protein
MVIFLIMEMTEKGWNPWADIPKKSVNIKRLGPEFDYNKLPVRMNMKDAKYS